MYFIGVVCTIALVPWLSDKYFGRKKVFVYSGVLFLIAFLALILTTDLIGAYICYFVMGALFGSRIIIGLTYTVEFMRKRYTRTTVLIISLSEPVALILMTMWD